MPFVCLRGVQYIGGLLRHNLDTWAVLAVLAALASITPRTADAASRRNSNLASRKSSAQVFRNAANLYQPPKLFGVPDCTPIHRAHSWFTRL